MGCWGWALKPNLVVQWHLLDDVVGLMEVATDDVGDDQYKISIIGGDGSACFCLSNKMI